VLASLPSKRVFFQHQSEDRIEQELAMNTQFLGSARRALAAIPMIVLLLTGPTSAMAQTATAAAVAPAPAPATPTRSFVDILVTGTVPGPPEDVNFTKVTAEIGSTLSRNSDPALPPVLIIDITFIKAPGVGATTKKKYVAEAEVIKTRPFATTQVLEITFPFTESKAAPTTADTTLALAQSLSGLATFTITVDANGVITGASGTIGANTF
jgi:hypothetical protein